MEYIPKATAKIKEAVAADNEGNYQQAFQLYMLGIDWYEMAYRHAPTPQAGKNIKATMLQYVARAEDLKQLNTHKQAQHLSTEYNSGTPGNNNDNNGMNIELVGSLKRSIMSEKPKIKLQDVVGLDEAKKSLKEAVIFPIQAPQLYSEDGDDQPWAAILLYGPPGTGKSYIAKAIAGESNATFFSLSSSDLISKYVGQSEQLIKTLFQMAREMQPSIVFIDEIESILSARGGNSSTSDHHDKVVTEMLVQMEGAGVDNTGVLVLGATNLPWALDMGSIRRLERRIYVPLPDPMARAQMFIKKLKGKFQFSKEFLSEAVNLTDNYSGADIRSIVKAACVMPRRRVTEGTHFKPHPEKQGHLVPCDPQDPAGRALSFETAQDKTIFENPPLTEADILCAIMDTKPTVDPTTLSKYVDWTAQLGIQ